MQCMGAELFHRDDVLQGGWSGLASCIPRHIRQVGVVLALQKGHHHLLL